MTPADLKRTGPGLYASRCGTFTMQKVRTGDSNCLYTWMLTDLRTRDNLGRSYPTLSRACEVASKEKSRVRVP